jgi:predicted dehydrogenase
VIGIAFVGTGFVADYYMTTLPNHPGLVLRGAYDRAPDQIERFSTFYKIRAYASLDEVIGDPDVAIVVNLTDPESHYEVTRRALEAGKHVYSEKPLAMRIEEAEALAELAARQRLTIAAAPANAISAAHRAVADALGTGAIGAPRLVYAEMEDGAVFRDKWRDWRSRSGAKWPGLHEFEIGCTLEHAGYALAWLISLFGPVETVTAFSALAFPDKGQGGDAPRLGPDFSVGCLNFHSGVVARLTSGLSAPRDRSMTILGERGAIHVRDLWDYHSAIHIERASEKRPLADRLIARLEHELGRALPFRRAPGQRLAVAKDKRRLPHYPSRIDFCGGIAAEAKAIAEGKSPFFSGDVALHITEIALALSNAGKEPATYRLHSTFNGNFPVVGL